MKIVEIVDVIFEKLNYLKTKIFFYFFFVYFYAFHFSIMSKPHNQLKCFKHMCYWYIRMSSSPFQRNIIISVSNPSNISTNAISIWNFLFVKINARLRMMRFTPWLIVSCFCFLKCTRTLLENVIDFLREKINIPLMISLQHAPNVKDKLSAYKLIKVVKRGENSDSLKMKWKKTWILCTCVHEIDFVSKKKKDRLIRFANFSVIVVKVSDSYLYFHQKLSFFFSESWWRTAECIFQAPCTQNDSVKVQ